MMMLWVSKTNEYCREEREHVSLNEGYKKLHAVHEQKHDAAEDIKSETHACAECPTEEDHASE